VKNTFELKNAKNVLIEDNEINYSWGGHGQDGYILMFTPRNQNGHVPESGVQNVTFRNNRCMYGAGAINLMGDDNNYQSLRTMHVLIEDNVFDVIDPKLYTGTNKLVMISRGPESVTINRNEFKGANIGSIIYFSGSPKCKQLVVTGNKFPTSKYGVFGDNSSTGNDPATGLPRAWVQYVESGTYADNVIG